tara:strand:- start:16 stop:1431 length:1416 start_codon:yes stop_codon:yes gene_type:complete
MDEEQDYPRHRWITNPLEGLNVLPRKVNPIPEPEFDDQWVKENKIIKDAENIAKEGLGYSLSLYGQQLGNYGTVANQPRRMINITNDVEEIFRPNSSIYKQARKYYNNHPTAGWSEALRVSRLQAGQSPEELAKRFMKSPKDRFPDADNIEAKLRKRKGESEEQFSNRYFEDKFNKIGLTEDAKFSLRNMLDAKTMSSDQRRIIKTGISNPNYSMKSYKETRKILVDEFLDGLEFLGIDENKIEAHHISGLRQTAQLFEGLDRSEFPEMLKLVYDAGLFTGNDPKNLMAIQKEAHTGDERYPNINAVHTYLTEELGLYGEEITGDFGVNIRDLSPQERLPYIQKLADTVKKSIPIAQQAIRDALDQRAYEREPKALLDAANDITKAELEQVKTKIHDYLQFQLTEPNYEALLDSVFGNESAGETMRRRGVKPGQPVQGQLLDLGRKPPRKTTKKDNIYPSGSGAYWDIESE